MARAKPAAVTILQRIGHELSSTRAPIVILVHGIRTFGDWQDQLELAIKSKSPDTVVIKWKYGLFDALSFLVGILRFGQVKLFTQFLDDFRDLLVGAKIQIVAHSFGSYIVAHALARLGPRAPQIDTVFFCGSVLFQNYSLHHTVGPDNRVKRLVNDCGTKDIWPLLAAILVPGMGAAGRYGFNGAIGIGVNVVNRFFPLDHGGYFASDHMHENLLPLLLQPDLEPDRHIAPPKATLFDGVVSYLLEPLKLLVILSPILFAVYGIVESIIQKDAADKARRAFSFSSSEAWFEKGNVAAATHGLALSATENVTEKERQALSYWASRLLGIQTEIAPVPEGSFFKWRNITYLKERNGRVTKVGSGYSYAAVSSVDDSNVVLVDETGHIVEFDRKTGSTRTITDFESLQWSDEVQIGVESPWMFALASDNRTLLIGVNTLTMTAGTSESYLLVLDTAKGIKNDPTKAIVRIDAEAECVSSAEDIYLPGHFEVLYSDDERQPWTSQYVDAWLKDCSRDEGYAGSILELSFRNTVDERSLWQPLAMTQPVASPEQRQGFTINDTITFTPAVSNTYGEPAFNKDISGTPRSFACIVLDVFVSYARAPKTNSDHDNTDCVGNSRFDVGLRASGTNKYLWYKFSGHTGTFDPKPVVVCRLNELAVVLFCTMTTEFAETHLVEIKNDFLVTSFTTESRHDSVGLKLHDLQRNERVILPDMPSSVVLGFGSSANRRNFCLLFRGFLKVYRRISEDWIQLTLDYAPEFRGKRKPMDDDGQRDYFGCRFLGERHLAITSEFGSVSMYSLDEGRLLWTENNVGVPIHSRLGHMVWGNDEVVVLSSRRQLSAFSTRWGTRLTTPVGFASSGQPLSIRNVDLTSNGAIQVTTREGPSMLRARSLDKGEVELLLLAPRSYTGVGGIASDKN